MSPWIECLLVTAAFVGHFSMTVWLFNRMHAVALPRKFIKTSEKILVCLATAVLLLFAWRWLASGKAFLPVDSAIDVAWLTYAAVCWLAATASVPLWLIPRLRPAPAVGLISNDTITVDVTRRLGYRPVHGLQFNWVARFPGNELLKVAVQEKTLRLTALPPALDGLRIAHLSDLHMTGKVTQEYYDVVVDETNALAPDLVLITGDILEKTLCLPWVQPTLGRLEARYGKFFIVGNHEQRLPDVAPLRQALIAAGFTDLGGRSLRLAMGGEDILLAGTELPWFGSHPPTAEAASAGFRILLSHTPDQLPWAKAHGFDLMLAGHNHGGQIRLPYLGALIVPSHYGFRYAGGLYFEPPTLLHVSRGLGGIHPIRLNCPPELALLVLKSA